MTIDRFLFLYSEMSLSQEKNIHSKQIYRQNFFNWKYIQTEKKINRQAISHQGKIPIRVPADQT
jgi:hypothetical protein